MICSISICTRSGGNCSCSSHCFYLEDQLEQASSSWVPELPGSDAGWEHAVWCFLPEGCRKPYQIFLKTPNSGHKMCEKTMYNMWSCVFPFCNVYNWHGNLGFLSWNIIEKSLKFFKACLSEPWITVPGIAHLNPTEAERMLCPVRQLKLYIRDSERIHGGPSADVSALESQHQRYYEEPHNPMDRGDCQGSLHSSWSRVRPCDGTWGESPFSVMGIQLSGSPTWHPVSGVLEVIWGLPEIVSTWHGLYPLQWRHNEGDSVSNHQPHDCYSTVYSGVDQRKHQSSASLAFVQGIHRGPANSPHKWPVTRKMFPFDDVIMRWWHVDTGSSGSRTTSSGSRTSSPSSIAYTICMQPLLRRS